MAQLPTHAAVSVALLRGHILIGLTGKFPAELHAAQLLGRDREHLRGLGNSIDLGLVRGGILGHGVVFVLVLRLLRVGRLLLGDVVKHVLLGLLGEVNAPRCASFAAVSTLGWAAALPWRWVRRCAILALPVALAAQRLAVSAKDRRGRLELRVLHMHRLRYLLKAEAVAAPDQDEPLVGRRQTSTVEEAVAAAVVIVHLGHLYADGAQVPFGTPLAVRVGPKSFIRLPLDVLVLVEKHAFLKHKLLFHWRAKGLQYEVYPGVGVYRLDWGMF